MSSKPGNPEKKDPPVSEAAPIEVVITLVFIRKGRGAKLAG